MDTDSSAIQENFHNLFDSIRKNDLQNKETYRNLLLQGAVRDQQAFNIKKKELQFALDENVQKQRNLYHNSDDLEEKVSLKRETSQNQSEPVMVAPKIDRKPKAKKSNQPYRPKRPTFRDLPIKKLFKEQGTGGGVTRAGYMKLVNQVQRYNTSTFKLKRKIVSQNKTIYYQQRHLQCLEKNLRRQQDKVRTYKAQIKSLQLKLIDKGLVTDIDLVSEEKKGSKKALNLTEIYKDNTAED